MRFKIPPLEAIGPDVLDESYASNRPITLPEDREEAIKAGKLPAWEEWHKGLLERKADAHRRWCAKMIREAEKWGVAAVKVALREAHYSGPYHGI